MNTLLVCFDVETFASLDACQYVCAFVGVLILSTPGKAVHAVVGLGFSFFPPSIPSFPTSFLPLLPPSLLFSSLHLSLPSSLPPSPLPLFSPSFPFLPGGGFPKVSVPLGLMKTKHTGFLLLDSSLISAGTAPTLRAGMWLGVAAAVISVRQRAQGAPHQLAGTRALWGVVQDPSLQLHSHHPHVGRELPWGYLSVTEGSSLSSSKAGFLRVRFSLSGTDERETHSFTLCL